MARLPDVPNVLKARIHFAVEGVPDVSAGFFVHYTGGPPTLADMNTYAGDILTSAASEFAALMTSYTSVIGADARDLSSDMGVFGTASGATPGTRTGDRLAPSTSLLVNYVLSRSYRGGHPRNYFPLGSGTDVAATGLWADAFITACDPAIGAFWNSLTSPTLGSFNPDKNVNVSYYGPPNIVVTNPVTGRARTVSTKRSSPLVNDLGFGGASKIISSQRRRNRAA